MPLDKDKQSVNLIRVASPHNGLEKTFVKVWRDQERNKLLANLLDPQPEKENCPATPTSRDYQVAETVVQWLGSPVGQGFIEEVRVQHGRKA